jgi:predicted branched-subunit amino acid permease
MVSDYLSCRLRAKISIVVGMTCFGMTYGVMAQVAGLSSLLDEAMSLVVFAE